MHHSFKLLNKYIARLLIDKLWLTLDILGEEHTNIFQRINNHKRGNTNLVEAHGNKVSKIKVLYKHHYYFITSKGNKILISFMPHNKGNRFMRLDYNPSKLSENEHEELKQFLIKILGILNFERIYDKAKITRIDIALDVKGLTPNEIWVKASKKQVCHIWVRGGIIETITLGTRNSEKCITSYDKIKQLNNQRKRKNISLIANKKRLRIEVSLSDKGHKTKYSIKTLPNIPCPYNKVEVYKPLLNSKVFHPSFADSCRIRGLQGALQNLDKDEKRRYMRYIKKNAIQIINPDEIWQHWDEVLFLSLQSLLDSKLKKD